VSGWDAAPGGAAAAAARGALDEVASSLEALLTGSDELVLAVPLPDTLELLERLARVPPPARLILDVASLKAPVLLAAAGLSAFVAGHPIAGSERSGPGAASADLFQDRAWIYDPVAAEPARGLAVHLIGSLGARPVPMAAAEHDRLIALTSHLPQVLAVALGRQLAGRMDEPGVRELCGPGIASMTRLGASPWTMWSGIFAANGPALAQEVRTLNSILSEAAAALDGGSAESLAAWFAQAAAFVAASNANGPRARNVVEKHPAPRRPSQ
jgi:prephenate dehydrogenase